MTRGDFYILAGQTQNDQWVFVGKLVEQITRKHHQVLIQVSNQAEAEALDVFLWTFKPDAFIPHALLNASDAPADCPVSIGWLPNNHGHHHDVLINLCEKLPEFFSRFERLVEVVIQTDNVLNYSREHYRFMKDRGYLIEHKDMRMR
ncbi:MAG: DNA polymerase III subunit chi [Oleibacter sp.]|nr:DNA polymerase III subunit chi [Thalassolituus sp.]